MLFIRVADGSDIHFCSVDSDGTIKTLNNRSGDPADYVRLYEQARVRGKSLLSYAGAIAARGRRLPWTLSELNRAPEPDQPHLLMPYVPPEVWGAAFTYDLHPGRAAKDDAHSQERVLERPVIFFKATPHRCVGPNDNVGSRCDTTAMIPEPELGLILSDSGEIMGYTVVNDVSSRDLPRENALYVTYSKTFTRCVSLGPVITPVESLPDPRDLEVHCRVLRGDDVLMDDRGSTSRMIRTFKDLIHHLTQCNAIPAGTLLASGTALPLPKDMHLIEGDWVEIEIEGIGRLANPVINV